MVAKRFHFLSVGLLVVAISVALFDYIGYDKAPPVQDIQDGEWPFQAEEDQEDKKDIVNDNEDVNQQASTEKEKEPAAKFDQSGEQRVVIPLGGTIDSVLTNLGFDKADIYLASKALTKVFNTRNLKAGQEIVVKGTYNDSDVLVLNGLEFQTNYNLKISVVRRETGFVAEKIAIPVKKIVRSISGILMPKSVDGSLKKCGVKQQVARDALRALSQVVNIRSSESPVDFEFLYRDFYREDGNVARSPELMYASILIGGKIIRVYNFIDGGKNEYVDSNGVLLNTVKSSKSMLAQPLGCMKVTSPFGFRRIPDGRVKKHTGVDLLAHTGTPVRAAANGTIAMATYNAGYGRYVNIKHSSSINTAYGHLSRIVVRNGQRVMKGQIVGYSGASGNSRGAHLHYEVLRNGRPINPMSFVKCETQKLTGQKLLKFNQFKKEVNLQIVGLTQIGRHKNSGKVA
ncbi:MAG: M23 family metallopeptidase [Holosporales bacterium]|nr:M23 family metallopeptidase [Holosporales bacterium]